MTNNKNSFHKIVSKVKGKGRTLGQHGDFISLYRERRTVKTSRQSLNTVEQLDALQRLHVC